MYVFLSFGRMDNLAPGLNLVILLTNYYYCLKKKKILNHDLTNGLFFIIFWQEIT